MLLILMMKLEGNEESKNDVRSTEASSGMDYKIIFKQRKSFFLQILYFQEVVTHFM